MAAASIHLTRQARLSSNLHTAGLDALILNPGPTLTYLTGLHFHLSERPVVVIFPARGTPSIILPELEAAKTNKLSYPIHSFAYPEDPAAWSAVFKAGVEHTGLQDPTIGIDPLGLRYLELELLQKVISPARFISAEDAIASLRMVKDDVEIENMQKAVNIAQDALAATLPGIKPGISEAAIARELSLQLIHHGSNPRLPFFPIVSGGPNSANPHAAPSERVLQEGDLLVIDYGASVNGYVSDITRTFAIGEVDPKYHQIAQIVLQANQAGRAAVKPGVSAGSIDIATRTVIENAGYGQFFTHRTGHGLGLEGHEHPYIRAGNHLAIEPGMTFTVEPGIYLPDENGVRIEDNVVVTQDGLLCLTTLPRQLITLPNRGT